jgi:hypothetical protein
MRITIAILLFAVSAAAQDQPLAAQQTRSPEALAALNALRAVQNATEIGVNFRDYTTRVIDAKTALDRYPADSGDQFRAKLATVAKIYSIAAQGWSTKIRYSLGANLAVGSAVLNDTEIAACPGMPEAIEKAKVAKPWYETNPSITEKQRTLMRRTSPQQPPAYYLGSDLESPALLWRCASGKLAEIEK